MAEVFLIVEGETEEQFYKGTFALTFQAHYFRVTQMPAKRNTTSRVYKGGNVSFDTCVQNVKRFLRSSTHCALVALIYDYYGLDATFLTHLTPQEITLDQKVNAIQKRLEREINDPRFRFILQVHEFESYLFADITQIAAHFNKPDSLSVLEGILQTCSGDPELINNARETAPSKRLLQLFPDYGKVIDGISITRKIGMANLRKVCKRFNAFCQVIESL